MAAAEQSGQPVLVAASAWRLAYVIGGRNHPAQALDLAMSAAGALERTMREPDADTQASKTGHARWPAARTITTGCIRRTVIDSACPAGADFALPTLSLPTARAGASCAAHRTASPAHAAGVYDRVRIIPRPV